MVMSVYNDSLPTEQQQAQAISRLKVAFPKQSAEFFALMIERVTANGFTAQRLKDAVNYCIDNFQYKELNISDIVRYDRHRKLITYAQLCDLVTSKGEKQSNYERLENGLWTLKK